MKNDPKHGGQRPGAGRKPFPEGETMLNVSIKLKPSQRDKLARLGGGVWIRDKIDKAKEPKEE